MWGSTGVLRPIHNAMRGTCVSCRRVFGNRVSNRTRLLASSLAWHGIYRILQTLQGGLGVVGRVGGVAVRRHLPRGLDGAARELRGLVCCRVGRV